MVDIAVEGGAVEPNSEDQPPAPGAPSSAARISPSTSKTLVEPPPNRGRVLASPSARALARQHGVPLPGITGSGSHGQITKDDIMAVVNSPPAPLTPGKNVESSRVGALKCHFAVNSTMYMASYCCRQGYFPSTEVTSLILERRARVGPCTIEWLQKRDGAGDDGCCSCTNLPPL